MIKFKKRNKILALILSGMLTVTSLVGCTNLNDGSDNTKKETPTEEKLSYDTETYAKGSSGAVSSGRKESTDVGMEILKAGGNAVDAAVATAFAIQFFEVESTGIAGGGFMMIYDDEKDETVVVDMRETAPAATTRDLYTKNMELLDKDKDGELSYYEAAYSAISTGVPGNVAGLELALKEYGTMTLEEVLEPVIKKGEQGIYVTDKVASCMNEVYTYIKECDESSKLWLDKDGFPRKTGDVIYNPDLIETYKTIAKGGSESFYTGPIAEAIVEEVKKHGGILTMEDMASYKPTIEKPVEGTYRDYKIVSSPPPSSGGTHLIQGLNILENFDMKALGHNSADSVFLFNEVAKYLYNDRAQYMADTKFADVPLKGLASKDYAKTIADKIDLNKANNNVTEGNPYEYEGKDTTHLSVIDKDGNMVSYTNTVNEYFGNGITVPGTGVVLNNELTDFDYKNPDSVNAPEPGKRPLSSMSPTLVFKPDGTPYIALGSPGGFTIFYTVLQVVSNIIDFDMDIEQAVKVPRTMFDFQGAWYEDGEKLYIEQGIPQEVLDEITKRGQNAIIKEGYYGSVNAIYRDENGVHSVADPRRDSHAAAY